MKPLEFSLRPFQDGGFPSGPDVTGHISRQSNVLSIGYRIIGPSAEFMASTPAEIPVRKNALWEETCMELFLAPKNSSQYWEFNLCPSGHWNVYRFESYRSDMREETAFTALPFIVRRWPDELQLILEIDLNLINIPQQTLDVAVSAVIKRRDHATGYWALSHTGRQPDFHRRDSFILEVDAESI